MPSERIDLNLLWVFEAVFEDRSLGLAGKCLNLSQSAISHALARMRQVVGDDLFVWTSGRLKPTVRALGLAAPVRTALQQIRLALGADVFDPCVTPRSFLVAAND
jgi:DNA-binding transcriptional LysR family regulator